VISTILIFASSCTIEKRKYLNGYHVDWFTAKKTENKFAQEKSTNKSKSAGSDSSSVAVIENDNGNWQSDLLPVIDPEPETLFVEHNEGDNEERSIASNDKEKDAEVVKKSSVGEEAEITDDYAEPVEHPKAQPSLTAGIIALAIPIVSSLLSYAIPYSHGLASALGPLSLVVGMGSIVLAILAIVWGGMAVRAIKANPGVYSGEGKARTGRALGWVYIGLLIVSLLVLILYIFFIIALLDAL